MMRALVLTLAVAVALGGLWLWRELRTAPSPSTRDPGAARASSSASRTAPADLRPSLDSSAAGPGERAPDGPPPPPGGERTWSSAPAPADGPDPFAPVPTVRTEADTRVGLPP